MSDELWLVSAGAVTAVGLTAPQSCAAIRAGVSGFCETAPPEPAAEPQVGAPVPAHASLKEDPTGWLSHLAARALKECLSEVELAPESIVLLLSVPESFRTHPSQRLQGRHCAGLLLRRLEGHLKVHFHQNSQELSSGHSAALAAIRLARQQLQLPGVLGCVIGGMDSLLYPQDLKRLRSAFRLKGEGFPQGVIPGEAAAFTLVVKPSRPAEQMLLARILGVGVAEEADTVLGARSSVGVGLRQALEQAVADAGLEEAAVSCRVSDMNSERYRAWESMIAGARFYRTRREVPLPSWYPAASVGDVGAASGALSLLVAARSLRGGYAPGTIAMCEGSSEGGQRAAVLLGAPDASGLSWSSDAARAPAVIPFVLAQHIDDAEFLWRWRSQAVFDFNMKLRDISGLEERLDAHLDGLLSAGPRGRARLRQQYGPASAGELFVLTVLTLTDKPPEFVLEWADLAEAEPVLAPGFVSALAWVPDDAALPILQELSHSQSAGFKALALRASTTRRRRLASDELRRLLSTDDSALLAAAIRAAAVFDERSLLSPVEELLGHPEPLVRSAAAVGGALLQSPRCAEVLLEESRRGGFEWPEEGVEVSLRSLPPHQGRRLWWDLARSDGERRLAIIGAAAYGTAEVIPWLLERLTEDEHARLAGFALESITGLDLDREKLSVAAPEDFEAGPSDNPDEESVQPDVDDALLWPDAEAVRRWWGEHAREFVPDVRYLCGDPVESGDLRVTLRDAVQPRRHAAALELRRLEGGLLFPTRARALQQRELLVRCV
jgi:3-oxoacyl-[acyl-carrier-protein] synthase-1